LAQVDVDACAKALEKDKIKAYKKIALISTITGASANLTSSKPILVMPIQ